MMKKFSPSSGTAEAEVALMFSSEAHISNPKNHCVPTTILDIPDEDDVQLLMVHLLQSWEEPKFTTIGEVLDFFHQIFEVLSCVNSPARVRYLAGVMNSDFLEMVDPTELYSVLQVAHPMQPYKARDFRSKPIHTTRTLVPVKYYLIDFGHSKKFDLSVPPGERLGDDIWKPKKGFSFLRRLIQDMCKENLKDRPTINEVVERFESICALLSDWKLRSPVVSKMELWFVTLFWSYRHRRTQIGLARQGVVAAIPNWSPERANHRPGILRRIFKKHTSPR
ncbi:hypothetical protein K443DRAFT_122275 [Laccaria amethystina LaAM-08-1]|uniref:Non-specific serine/threonine protein kinase n=1 Tax=Laccaria amethystina LaAM-08-1 TaxID=1095629 RepID=A0A0C9WSA0_9AGAR|nr:hypothetical protein K443DRAFT_122275 [Laccaria amethystina LaAM-08-1]